MNVIDASKEYAATVTTNCPACRQIKEVQAAISAKVDRMIQITLLLCWCSNCAVVMIWLMILWEIKSQLGK